MCVMCKDCSIEMMGEDLEVLAGFISRATVAEGYGLYADCEECGPVLVDHEGRRIPALAYDA